MYIITTISNVVFVSPKERTDLLWSHDRHHAARYETAMDAVEDLVKHGLRYSKSIHQVIWTGDKNFDEHMHFRKLLENLV
jgi:hypothetical protein